MPRPNDQAGSLTASVDPSEIPELVGAIREGFNSDKTRSKAWRIAQLQALDRMMSENRDELAESLFKDLHKDKFQSYIQEMAMVHQEIYDAIKHLDEWMEDEVVGTGLMNAPAKSVIQKDPLGVVLILGAWNYNILLTIQPMVGAIAAGNCVIIKPGSYSVNSSNVMVRLVNQYMDPECIFAVEGNRHITNALLEQRFDKIFFTGSTFVGKVVAEAAAKQLCPVVLELGGKSPCVVDRTADINVAAHRYVWGATMNCGQTCVRPDYLMVHDAIADEFIRQVKAVVIEYFGRDPRKSEFYGRLVNESAFNRLKKCLDSDSKYIAFGGAFDAEDKYIEPTLFDFGNDMEAFKNSQLMSDEIFGPLLPMFRYRDFDHEVLSFIRAGDKPLALYCFSTDEEVSERLLRLTSSGGAIINDVVVHLVNPELPFGGVGASGMGSYHGKFSFDCFSHKKAVIRRMNALDVSLRYPPYSSFEQSIMEVAMKPQGNYYYHKLAHTLGDKKNLALGLMGAYILRGYFKGNSKL